LNLFYLDTVNLLVVLFGLSLADSSSLKDAGINGGASISLIQPKADENGLDFSINLFGGMKN